MTTTMSPLVSVCVPTYQHVGYISQCLDSILEQEVTFPFEVLVGEDGSDDGTRDVCREYARAHPDRIRLFLNSREDVIYIDGRPTGRRNLSNLMASARGRYIAMLEGDDWWVDREKLARQVSLLERRPDLAACFGQVVDHYEETGEHGAIRPRGIRNDLDTRALLRGGNVIPTLTVLWRRSALPPAFPEWLLREAPMADYPLHIMASRTGNIGCIQRVFGRYRAHRRGLWSSQSSVRLLDAKVKVRQLMLDHLDLPEPLRRDLRDALGRFRLARAAAIASAGDRQGAIRALRDAGVTSLRFSARNVTQASRLGLALAWPRGARGIEHVEQRLRRQVARRIGNAWIRTERDQR